MDTSAAKRAFKLRRVEGIVRNFVARHAGHKTDAQKCMHARMIPLFFFFFFFFWVGKGGNASCTITPEGAVCGTPSRAGQQV